MPADFGTTSLDVTYPKEPFDRIRLGLYPRQMEDKWFIYYDEPWLHLHRSWTGCLIFSVRFEKAELGGRAVELQVNQDPSEYRAGTLVDEAQKAVALVDRLLAWNVPGAVQGATASPVDGSNEALEDWSELGRAMLGGGPAPGYDVDAPDEEQLEVDFRTPQAPEADEPSPLEILDVVDSDEAAAARRRELAIPRHRAAELGRSALDAAESGAYLDESGNRVEWGDLVEAARSAKVSIPPDAPLPSSGAEPFPRTRVQVTNETTLGAARRLVARDLQPVALNFANGIHPGGGFLQGARAQEEALCRSSSLYSTLEGDPMYAAHRERPRPDSTDWAIYSPGVPVFRTDDGCPLPRPWLLDIITCAAPYAPRIGQPAAGDLLETRIHRVLAIAHAYGHSALVLGAWGCGAFGNDPNRTARDFRDALERDFGGAFSEVVFAVTDWSPERRYLGPFRDVFATPREIR